jgi:hypothetical protein
VPQWEGLIVAAASFLGAGVGAAVGAVLGLRTQRERRRLTLFLRYHDLYLAFLTAYRKVEALAEQLEGGRDPIGLDEARRDAWNAFAALKSVASQDLDAAANQLMEVLAEATHPDTDRSQRVYDRLVEPRRRLEQQAQIEFSSV